MEKLSQMGLLEQITRLRNEIQDGDSSYRKLLRECEKIEIKLNKDKLNQKGLIKLNYRLIKLRIRHKNYSDTEFTNLVVGSTYIFMIYGLGLIVFRYIALYSKDPLTNDFFSFLCFTMVGVAGALLNLFTKGIGGERDFSFRMLITILFPVVFMNLFKINGNQIVGILAVNIIMFTCGFSSEFILSFLNKIVEIAKKVINVEGASSKKELDVEIENRLAKVELLINDIENNPNYKQIGKIPDAKDIPA
ncbi:hypothetical protein SAMN04487895_104200 [Paenibacillus sophorae]|uniref:Uncharacterized protein n=1 Tax=Paenibacillus sophorae TaxID=1333845 RepID=A0A1H8L7L5_9BACL|nr:hypothetical protein [Paenibacillus sophorae]QWU17413.1 hypothetical protein KP014_09795 [Paenibacillus sophorae]SEO00698.1 hypothetical protein SAMN04487895_104200 [Paenibacillus sophorae]